MLSRRSISEGFLGCHRHCGFAGFGRNRSLLAAQGRDLPQVTLTMLAFGVGAALPLLALGWISRETLMRWRSRLVSTGKGIKSAFGLLFIASGVLVISGLDKAVETWLADASPIWLTEVTTRF